MFFALLAIILNAAVATAAPETIGEFIPRVCYETGNYALLHIMQVIHNIIRWLFGLTGFLALIMFFYGGTLFLLSAGESGKIKAGKSVMVNAVIGLCIIFGSWAFVNLVIGLFIEGKVPSGTVAILGVRWGEYDDPASCLDIKRAKEISPCGDGMGDFGAQCTLHCQCKSNICDMDKKTCVAPTKVNLACGTDRDMKFPKEPNKTCRETCTAKFVTDPSKVVTEAEDKGSDCCCKWQQKEVEKLCYRESDCGGSNSDMWCNEGGKCVQRARVGELCLENSRCATPFICTQQKCQLNPIKQGRSFVETTKGFCCWSEKQLSNAGEKHTAQNIRMSLGECQRLSEFFYTTTPALADGITSTRRNGRVFCPDTPLAPALPGLCGTSEASDTYGTRWKSGTVNTDRCKDPWQITQDSVRSPSGSPAGTSTMTP